MESDNQKEERYLQAKKRVDELKKFYVHLIVFIIINTFISSRKIIKNIDNGETFSEAFFDFTTFSFWFFWGIGLVFHAFKVFGVNGFLGKEWEARKIKEELDKQKNSQ